MPQRLRIFVSSPSDVRDERLRAALIVDKLSQDYSRFFAIEAYRWEHEAMLASAHFQDAIELPSAFDIVVLILWSRLGTPLPEKTTEREYRGMDGRAPVTGTEWEYEEALKVAREKKAPDLLAFRNISPAPIDTRDPAAQAASMAQLAALNQFWTRHFADRGVFLAAYDEYHTLDDFALRLEESLRKLIERRIKDASSGQSQATPIWLGEPFRGLESYEFEHAPIFFGRDAAITKATEQLAAQARSGCAFLLVSGASGSGKSSLVKAGIVPRLMKPQRISGAAFIRRCILRPGNEGADIFLGLARILTRGDGRDVGLPELTAPGQDAIELAAHLRSAVANPGYLFANALGRLTEAERQSGRLLAFEAAKLILVVDQLEELFTSPAINAEDRRLFVRLLAGLARSESVWVVATLRADFWHRAAEIPELLDLAGGAGRIDLAAPSAAELAEMIRKPAQAAGLSFEAHADSGLGLDAVLAQDAAAAPGALPLLSFTLDELYKHAQARGESVLTHAGYQALGGLEGSIANRAEEVVAGLPQAAQAALPRVLRALTTVDGSREQAPIGRPALLSNFAEGTPARLLIDAFVAARLLVASSEAGASGTVRLAHEALIGRWKRAHDQLAADRRDLDTRAIVERQFSRWSQAHGAAQRQLLIRDPDLANALDLVKRWGDELEPGLRNFIQASDRRARLLYRTTVAAAALFALLAITATVLGGLTYSAKQQAEIQKQRLDIEQMNRRAALAQQLALADNPQTAAAVALDALRTGAPPTPELRDAIHRTLSLTATPNEHYLAENVFNLAVSPDGHTLAAGMAGNAKGTVYILDSATLVPRFELKFGNDVASGLDFSADGKRLVIAGDKIPNVWNAETGTKLFDLQRPGAASLTFQAKFSPDGSRILVTSVENRAFVYDSQTGQLLQTLQGATYEEMRDRARAQSPSESGAADPIDDAVNHASFGIWGAATYAAFSPDGKTIAVTGPANPDGSVRLFDVATGALVRTLSGGRSAGIAPPLTYGDVLTFSADGNRLVAAVANAIKTWQIANGALISEIPIQGIGSLALTGDGEAAVSVQDDGAITFSCLAGGVQVASVKAHQGSIDSLAVAHNGQLFATGSTDRTTRVWRMPTGAEICSLAHPTPGPDHHKPLLSSLRPFAIFTGYGARVSKSLFLDGDRVLMTASQDGWVRGWRAPPGADTTSFALPFASSSDGWQRVLASGDSHTIFAYDGEVWRAWDIASSKPIEIPDDVAAIAPGDHTHGPILFQSPEWHFQLGARPPQHDSFLFSTWRGPVSTDGSRIVVYQAPTSPEAADQPAVLMDSSTNKALVRLVADGRNAKDLFFSPDGSLLFGRLEKPQKDTQQAQETKNQVGGDGLAVWDARSGTLISFVAAIQGFSQWSGTRVSQNGNRLLWQPLGGQLELYATGPDGFRPIGAEDLAFHGIPIGRSGSSTGSTMSAWDLSGDGKFIAVGREDGTIVFAGLDGDMPWRVLDTRGLAIKKIAISPAGTYTVAADTSNTVWIFDSMVGELVRSQAFPADIISLSFMPDGGRLIVLYGDNLTIVPALPTFAGNSDTDSMVEAARKLGLHLVSEEDQRRYKLGALGNPDQASRHRWAAIDPNSEDTATVVWADTREEARSKAIAACQQNKTDTCASSPAVTSDLDATFVYYCCMQPRVGCAIASGSGDDVLRSVKQILANAKYSQCEVRRTYSARDGSQIPPR